MTDPRSDYIIHLRGVMKTNDGKAFLSRFVRDADKECFTGQSNTSFYNEGRAGYARQMCKDMREADLDLFLAIERIAWKDQSK